MTIVAGREHTWRVLALVVLATISDTTPCPAGLTLHSLVLVRGG